MVNLVPENMRSGSALSGSNENINSYSTKIWVFLLLGVLDATFE